MSIFELFFNCNKEKTNTQMSCTERFQSCMFTASNKAAAENGFACNERKVYELPLNSGTLVTSSVDVPVVGLSPTLTLAPLLSEPDTQGTLFLQVVGDATVPDESYAKLQTQNTDVLSSDEVNSSVLDEVKAIEPEYFTDVPTILFSGSATSLRPFSATLHPLDKEAVTDPEFVEKGALAYDVPINDIVSPTQHDTLFWCIYIVTHGYNDYLQIGRNYGVKELELKKLIGESIQSYPNQLKQSNYKITKVAIQEILSDLMTSQKETNMLCLIAMISYFKLNIIIVNSTKKLMLEFVCLPDITTPTYILYKDAYGKYSIKTTPIFKVEIELMKSTMVCLENYIKPLKPISTYKIDDLILIAKKVGIYNETDKPKKNELYEQINNNITWR